MKNLSGRMYFSNENEKCFLTECISVMKNEKYLLAECISVMKNEKHYRQNVFQ